LWLGVAALPAAEVPRERAEQIAVAFGSEVFGPCVAAESWRYDDLNGTPAVYLVGLSFAEGPWGAGLGRSSTCPDTGRGMTVMVAANDNLFPVLQYRTGQPLNRRRMAALQAKAEQALGTALGKGLGIGGWGGRVPSPFVPGQVTYRRGIFYSPLDLWLEFSDGSRTIYVSPSGATMTGEELFSIAPASPEPNLMPAIRAEWARWNTLLSRTQMSGSPAPFSRKHWISGVPDYDWHFGCSPSAATNVLAYWDRGGYSRLVDSVWYNRYDPLEHDYDSVPNCNLELALAMGTDTVRRGATYVDSMVPGILRVCNSPEYGNNYLFTSWKANEDLTALIREINADRPGVLCLLGHPRYGNHAVTFVGWGPPDTNWICIHDEWSTGTPPDTVVQYYWAGGRRITMPIHPGGFTGPDVGTSEILAPRGVLLPDSVTPRAKVENYGTAFRTFWTFFRIEPSRALRHTLHAERTTPGAEGELAHQRRAYSVERYASGVLSACGDGSSYLDSQLVADLAPGAALEISFRNWAASLGTYVTVCSTALDDDSMTFNDARQGQVRIDTLLPIPWTAQAPMPAGPKGRCIRQGGSLTTGEGMIYAFKGAGTCEFYAYSPIANSWQTLTPIPRLNAAGKKRGVKRGGALAYADGRIHATKGNSTLEFWQYDLATSTWVQKADVPPGRKKVSEGAGLAACRIGDTTWIYLLRGSGTFDFYRFNTATNVWQTLPLAPTGASGKGYRDGSCLLSDGKQTIYLLKSSVNEFYAYDAAEKAWSRRSGLPLVGCSRRRKTAKAGAALCLAGRDAVFALKGNSTREFWAHDIVNDYWIQLEDVPAGVKTVRAGGALAFVRGRIYALKGNGTLDLFMTVPDLSEWGMANAGPRTPDSGLPLSGEGAAASPHRTTALRSPHSALLVVPNPFRGSTVITYSLPRAGKISLRLYDVTGALVTTLVQGYHNAGSSSFIAHRSSLASGIYLLRLEAVGCNTSRKLILVSSP
jgi:hypothetical protein